MDTWPYYTQDPMYGQACSPQTGKNYTQDKLKITSYNYLVGVNNQDTVNKMMQALYLRGSIITYLDIYLDFYYYSSGIYDKNSNVYYGGHAVRIIGYGTTAGIDYWLVANSWGSWWGDKGYFKIRRGANTANIESLPIEGIV